jgi:hypothetical protein
LAEEVDSWLWLVGWLVGWLVDEDIVLGKNNFDERFLQWGNV